jgi:hypothetical protein
MPEIAPPAKVNPDDISSVPNTQRKATSYPQREPIYTQSAWSKKLVLSLGIINLRSAGLGLRILKSG